MTKSVTRENFIVTRRSLVERLANWRDQKNWQEFFRTYRKLIYTVARKSGLTESEAEDVVQETVITVAKRIDSLKYDPAIGSFKGWLLQITRWRIADQFRKRQPAEQQKRPANDDTSQGTATVERAADPAGFDLAAQWEIEWKENLFEAAKERVKLQVDPKQYQIFDCYVIKEWPAQKVVKELEVSIAQVYLAKHRVGGLFKKELKALASAGV